MLFMNSLIQVLGDYYLYFLAGDLGGKKCALISLGTSLFNRRMNEIFGKTLTNTPESLFCLVGLYYYNRLKPKFDRNMMLMVVFISLAFIIRSSSLIGWIPLAMFKMFQSVDYFVAILQSGLLIAVPTILISIYFDCLAYGTFTVPMINFVHVNVVENISKYFGTSPWYFYLQELPEFILSHDGIETALLGMCLLTVKQLHQKKVPAFALFGYATILVLTAIPHKE